MGSVIDIHVVDNGKQSLTFLSELAPPIILKNQTNSNEYP
jgi:hypothetical protein